MSSEAAPPREIAIVGGGIIGCSVAYFLTRHPAYSPAKHRITLLEAASTSSGGRTPDSLQDAAALADPAPGSGPAGQTSAAQPRNPAHDGIAGGASGKAGGLLAAWAFPSNIVPLSFKLHEQLAAEHGGERRWGYRRCHASQVDCRARLPPGISSSDERERRSAGAAAGDPKQQAGAGASKGLHKDHKKDARALAALGAPADLDWVDTAEALGSYEAIGTPANTAQVHPELFTRAMAQLAEDAGVRIVTGARVTAIDRDGDDDASSGGRVRGVTYTDTKGGGEEQQQHLPATDVVVAAGPWTRRLLPSVPVTAARAHSVVVRTPRPLSAYALFTAIALPAGFPAPTTGSGSGSQNNKNKDKKLLKRPQTVEPEIYARPDGTAYACGPTDDAAPLPDSTADVAVDAARCDDVARQVASISDELLDRESGGGAEVLARQACYLPQGGPWIGPVGGAGSGLVVAAGHTCWGIQNAPATGKLVSEIVLDGAAKSARLGGCDPSRLS
ncbi:FAD dependent oxidoreductase [Xylariaceae sp. FL0804]|nr:FAD dependent oxidoreductase [Xylariaceae sp. FL0804]